MDLSMRWLKDYVDIGEVSMRDFSEAMSMSGSKVEGWKTEFDEVKNVVVGKILSVEKHPDSDHLVICQLDVGQEEPVQIVTGASNVHAGDIVPVALHKSELPNGVKITKGKLRGVMSNGMLCSLGELGLTKGDFPYAIEDGIFLIEEDCQIGQDIASALGCDDTTVEFEITPNRPDCLSVIGLAREAAATFHKPLNLHQPEVKGCGGDIHDYLSVEVQNTGALPALCGQSRRKCQDRPVPALDARASARHAVCARSTTSSTSPTTSCSSTASRCTPLTIEYVKGQQDHRPQRPHRRDHPDAGRCGPNA